MAGHGRLDRATIVRPYPCGGKMDYYVDADDRLLTEFYEDQETAYLEGHMFINEDIELPLLVVNGVAYY